ncbi:hypothetical protein O3P69_006257 [Scylla paramamosain]|uniref:Uncharacterized protein n=1 Tax=Scylla paramamosain TaxID=85552 RepID=A0AAW0U6X7_SCYPA
MMYTTDLSPVEIPQLVLLTFDDAVNDLKKGLYKDLINVGRKDPNGCPIASIMYVSHKWTEYSQVRCKICMLKATRLPPTPALLCVTPETDTTRRKVPLDKRKTQNHLPQF